MPANEAPGSRAVYSPNCRELAFSETGLSTFEILGSPLSYLTSFVFGAIVTIRATHEGLPGEGMEEQLWLSR